MSEMLSALEWESFCLVHVYDLCAYFGAYQKLVSLIKQVVSLDREGNCPLRVASVKESMPILGEFDAINFLREFGYWSLHIQVCLGGSAWDC